MKICIDCKYCDRQAIGILVSDNPDPSKMLCKHPEAATRDVIVGLAYCSNERSSNGRKGCGKEARLWAQK